jgi:lauroyl/myristoyl acyltransferase
MQQGRTDKRYLTPQYWSTWALLGCMRAASLLPLPLLVAFGGACGELLYLLAFERRRVARINLRIAFPDADARRIRRLNRACFRNVSIGILEIGLAWWAPGRVRALTEVVGLDHLEAARLAGTGAILLTGHFTCLTLHQQSGTLAAARPWRDGCGISPSPVPEATESMAHPGAGPAGSKPCRRRTQ